MKEVRVEFCRSVITALIIFLVGACTQNQLAKDPNLYAVPVNNFSKSVELLISNADFLEEEVMKINAQSPSVQRIIIGADILIKEKEYIKANNELERAFRITNTDSARTNKVFGSPSFVVNDEIFWGDDRMEDAIYWSKK